MNYLRNVQSWIFTCTMTRYGRAVQQTAVRMIRRTCYCHSTSFFLSPMPPRLAQWNHLIQMTPRSLWGLRAECREFTTTIFSLYGVIQI